MSALAQLRRVIADVPRGKVITYGQVATAGGFPGAARLTVWALQSGEGLPWHRVVGAGGRIALPGEQGREQRLLLKIEGVKFRGGRVRMDLHNWMPRAAAKARVREPGHTGRSRAGRFPGWEAFLHSRGTTATKTAFGWTGSEATWISGPREESTDPKSIPKGVPKRRNSRFKKG